MSRTPVRRLDRRHQQGAPRRRRGPQAGHPDHRDPGHQLRPRPRRLPDPGQRRRDPRGRPADPRDRRRRRRRPDRPLRRQADGDGSRGVGADEPLAEWERELLEGEAEKAAVEADRWRRRRGDPGCRGHRRRCRGRRPPRPAAEADRGRRRGAAEARRGAARRADRAAADAADGRRPRPPATTGRGRRARSTPVPSTAHLGPTDTAARRRRRTEHGELHRRRRQEAPRAHRRRHDGLQEGARRGRGRLRQGRRDAAHQGRKKAAKRGAEREAATGLVATPAARCVELNCETDFVAKSERVRRRRPADRRRGRRAPRPADAEALKAVDARTARPSARSSRTLAVTIGEKIELGRGRRTSTARSWSTCTACGRPAAGRSACWSSTTATTRTPPAAPRCRSPRCGRSTSPATRCRPTSSRTEREIAEATAREEGKPEQAIAKIIEGRLNGFFKDVVLLEQPSVTDNKKTVKAVLDEAGVEVKRFARFEVGA